MFPDRFFAPCYFAPRYFPRNSGEVPEPPIVQPAGVAGKIIRPFTYADLRRLRRKREDEEIMIL